MTSLDATQADERLVLTTPRSAVLLSLPIFLATAALGLWFIGQSTNFIDTAWSWLGVVFLLAGAAVSVVSLFRPTRLILTPEGFHLTGPFSPGLIPWGEVEVFTAYSEPAFLDADGLPVGGVPLYAVWRLYEASDSSKHMVSRLSRAADMPFDGALPRNIGLDPDALAELLEQWRVHYG
ncbi:MAG: hypothetical protein P0Y50_05700 [Candidatus Brevundimonas colombiensis]|uniref:PH domain-containing protein n=1 Tax=Candidatus Brevundimonas colombiensis TaxID=3121376 RepID=A0AAJ5X365_9CAUL|nr:hypothetical protein [Brevundimonas sp.]WEK41099.1 MAG: hypothetical protein P0Y50_05700 [Brevundimonas sp.]